MRKVFVVMALFQPDRRFLAEQTRSVLCQSHANLELVIVPDGPDAELETELARLEDARIRLCPQTEHVGIYRNFLRGLSIALSHSTSDQDLFAYCDQDDVWAEDKLARQCDAMAGRNVTMCYGDAGVVDSDGRDAHVSLFKLERRAAHRNLDELLIVNDVTGATMVFTEAVARIASQGPDGCGGSFLHDWWTALVAASLGRTVFLPEPLASYRRHEGNVIGPKTSDEARSGRKKRPFLSSPYLRMCREQMALRQYLLSALGERVPGGFQHTRISRALDPRVSRAEREMRLCAGVLKWALSGRPTLARHATRLSIGNLLVRSIAGS